MSLDKFLHFIFNYNVLIIEVLFAMSLATVVFLSIRLFAQNETENKTSPDWKNLEENIKKILENAALGKPSSSATTATSDTKFSIPEGASESVVVQEMQTQLERNQLMLMQKEQELEQLKKDLASVGAVGTAGAAGASGGGVSQAEVDKYEEKIKDLESRLNEYSIIEDDIADLSFYKEETVRLQTEVDKLKSQLESIDHQQTNNIAETSAKALTPPQPQQPQPKQEVESTASQPPSPPPPPPPLAQSDPVATAPVSTTSQSASVQTTAPVKTNEPSDKTENPDDLIDNDIMAEFERAVAEQKASAAPASATKKSAEIEVSSEPQVEEPSAIENPPVVDESLKLKRETVTKNAIENIEEPKQESENSESQVIDVNFDKMLSEATDLNSMNVENKPESQNTLDQSLDTDKLLQEASGMDEITEKQKQGA